LSFNEIGEADYESRLLGHTKTESAVSYLGIEIDDASAVPGQVDLRIDPGRADMLCPSVFRLKTPTNRHQPDQ
jgi:hypothetical protein